MKVKIIITSFVSSLLILGVGIFSSQGIEVAKGLDLSGYFKNETYIRPWSGPDDIMSCRNVVNLEFKYDFPGGQSIFKRFFLQLRPFYDAVFDLENDGTGGARGGQVTDGRVLPPLQNRHIRHKYQDNFGVADDWDPLLRECWMELQIGNLGARLGRQLVSWGKSDGIYLLDMINPFNFRNWSVFDEEDTKIPLWMANLTYRFTPTESLQLLIIPRYVPQYDAGDGHDWAANVTKYVEEFYGDPGYYFGFPGLFGQTLIDYDEPDYGDPGNWQWGVRWGGMWKGITYSLNYFYTWDPIMNDWPQDPYGMVYKRNPDRISIFGGSFDYAFAHALGMQNWVLRGEAAYFRNDVFVDQHFLNNEKGHIDYMIGFDKYFFVDYWVSIQILQSWILDSPSWRNPYLTVSARLKELLTIPGVGTFPISEGFRDAMETTLTFYVFKELLPGDTMHTEWFLLLNDEGDLWFRPKVKYDVNDQLHVSLGFNLYWGHQHDPFGEFKKNDNVFFEFKWGF